MSIVAILGGRGSGKTVFLTALAKRYAEDNESGCLMVPASKEALRFGKDNWINLERCKWPPPTPEGTMLELWWELTTPKGKYVLSACDFAGETYRRAFAGESAAEVNEPERRLVATVDEADVLLLLVNLSDLTDDPNLDARLDAEWSPQSVLQRVAGRHGVKVALVFTQVDRYRGLLEECGGSWSDVAKKYVSSLLHAFPKLEVFGVSAVNRTTPNPKNPRFGDPAKEFESEGFDSVIDWIASCMARVKRIRLVKRVVYTSIVVLMIVAGVGIWSMVPSIPPRVVCVPYGLQPVSLKYESAGGHDIYVKASGSLSHMVPDAESGRLDLSFPITGASIVTVMDGDLSYDDELARFNLALPSQSKFADELKVEAGGYYLLELQSMTTVDGDRFVLTYKVHYK